MDKTTQAFSFKITPNVSQILHELGCTISLSTYQAGKLIFLSAPDARTISQLPRNFNKPMGIALEDNKMAIASLGEVLLLKNLPEMAWDYPNQPKTYDALFLPRATYHTGMLDIHDVAFSGEDIIGINTQYSCICKIDHNYSFTPFWQPHFITKLAPQDRCHLNGLAMHEGKPLYVSALSQTDIPNGWRKHKVDGGILMHVPTNTIVCSGLAMPHSPRYYDGKVYILLSALGQLACFDPKTEQLEIIADLGGFARGMSREGKYLFIGLSKIRKKSKGFKDLPIADKANQAGVIIFDMELGKTVGFIIYESSVDEIYDVKVLKGIKRPGIVTPQKQAHRFAVSYPGTSFWKIPKK